MSHVQASRWPSQHLDYKPGHPQDAAELSALGTCPSSRCLLTYWGPFATQHVSTPRKPEGEMGAENICSWSACHLHALPPGRWWPFPPPWAALLGHPYPGVGVMPHAPIPPTWQLRTVGLWCTFANELLIDLTVKCLARPHEPREA